MGNTVYIHHAAIRHDWRQNQATADIAVCVTSQNLAIQFMSACRFISSKQIFRSMHSMAILTLYGPHVHIVTKRTSLSRDCGTDAQSKRRFYEPQHVSLVPIAEAAHITLFAPHQAYLPLS